MRTATWKLAEGKRKVAQPGFHVVRVHPFDAAVIRRREVRVHEETDAGAETGVEPLQRSPPRKGEEIPLRPTCAPPWLGRLKNFIRSMGRPLAPSPSRAAMVGWGSARTTRR